MILKKKLKQDYTVVTNKIFRKDLSLQAIGLYLYLTSKPSDWTFSLEGTSKQVASGKHAISSAFKELEALGFVKKQQKRADGKLAENDLILTDLPSSGKPSTEKPSTGNRPQVNTNLVNTNKVNTNRELATNKNSHKRLPKDSDIENINVSVIALDYKVPESFVFSKWDDVVNYCHSNNKKYSNFERTLRSFVKRDALKIMQGEHERSSKNLFVVKT